MRTFEVHASSIRFPFAEQAGQLTRSIQLPDKPVKEPETEFLVTSRSPCAMNAEQMLSFDRKYWGIESMHQRLDCIAGEDRSRVQGNAALNLAVIRRAVVSVAAHWIRHCKDKRRPTMSSFYDAMSAQNAKKAFKLATVCKRSNLDDP